MAVHGRERTTMLERFAAAAWAVGKTMADVAGGIRQSVAETMEIVNANCGPGSSFLCAGSVAAIATIGGGFHKSAQSFGTGAAMLQTGHCAERRLEGVAAMAGGLAGACMSFVPLDVTKLALPGATVEPLLIASNGAGVRAPALAISGSSTGALQAIGALGAVKMASANPPAGGDGESPPKPGKYEKSLENYKAMTPQALVDLALTRMRNGRLLVRDVERAADRHGYEFDLTDAKRAEIVVKPDGQAMSDALRAIGKNDLAEKLLKQLEEVQFALEFERRNRSRLYPKFDD